MTPPPMHARLTNRPRALVPALTGALAPLFLAGCTDQLANDLPLIVCVSGAVASAFALGVLVALAYHVEIYRFWQRIVTDEHLTDMCRLTDAATEMAREAERAIAAAERALIDLRTRMPALVRHGKDEWEWRL